MVLIFQAGIDNGHYHSNGYVSVSFLTQLTPLETTDTRSASLTGATVIGIAVGGVLFIIVIIAVVFLVMILM